MGFKSGAFTGQSKYNWVVSGYESLPSSAIKFAVVILKIRVINTILIMKMLSERQRLIIKNVQINMLAHVSGHLIEWFQSIVRKTPPNYHRPISGLILTLYTFRLKCFIWPLLHSCWRTDDVLHLNNGKKHDSSDNITFRQSPSVHAQWFLSHWRRTTLSACVNNGLLQGARLQTVYCMQFPLQCYLC